MKMHNFIIQKKKEYVPCAKEKPHDLFFLLRNMN